MFVVNPVILTRHDTLRVPWGPHGVLSAPTQRPPAPSDSILAAEERSTNEPRSPGRLHSKRGLRRLMAGKEMPSCFGGLHRVRGILPLPFFFCLRNIVLMRCSPFNPALSSSRPVPFLTLQCFWNQNQQVHVRQAPRPVMRK